MPGIVTKEEAAVPPRPAAEDLSTAVEQSVERRPNERVKAVRVSEDCYRCNWWVQEGEPHHFWLPAATIRKSRFLRAANTAEGLVVEDITIRRGKNSE